MFICHALNDFSGTQQWEFDNKLKYDEFVTFVKCVAESCTLSILSSKEKVIVDIESSGVQHDPMICSLFLGKCQNILRHEKTGGPIGIGLCDFPYLQCI